MTRLASENADSAFEDGGLCRNLNCNKGHWKRVVINTKSMLVCPSCLQYYLRYCIFFIYFLSIYLLAEQSKSLFLQVRQNVLCLFACPSVCSFFYMCAAQGFLCSKIWQSSLRAFKESSHNYLHSLSSYKYLSNFCRYN